MTVKFQYYSEAQNMSNISILLEMQPHATRPTYCIFLP